MTTAAAWVHPRDDVDRGNVLGAAVVAARRAGAEIAEIVEGDRAHEDAACAAAARTGLLVVPISDRVTEGPAGTADLISRARAEGWRLLLLDQGIDSSTPAADRSLDHLRRLAALGDPEPLQPVPPVELRAAVG